MFTKRSEQPATCRVVVREFQSISLTPVASVMGRHVRLISSGPTSESLVTVVMTDRFNFTVIQVAGSQKCPRVGNATHFMHVMSIFDSESTARPLVYS